MSLLGNIATGIFQSIIGGALGGPRGLTAFLSEVRTPSIGDWIAYMGRPPTPQEAAQYGLAGRDPRDVYATLTPELYAAVPGPMPPLPLPPPTFPRGAIVPMPPGVPGTLARAARWVFPILRRYGQAIAQLVWETYQTLRIQGVEEKQARSRAMAVAGVRRRRRGRGISASQLRAFERVSRTLDRYCQRTGFGRARKVPRRARRRGRVC